MTTYKLTYFPVEAKGELIRFIFAQAEIPYEDVRVTWEDWPALKPSTPFGYLPLLEFSGETLAGSGPIARYLAEKHGLAGSSDLDNAKIAAIKDIQDEAVMKMVKAFFEKNEETKGKMKDEVIKDFIPKYLGLMEKTIKNNTSEGGWLFGSKVTYVDLNLYLVTDFMKEFKEDNLFDEYSGVKKLRDAVAALPNIAQWIKKRPERTFGPPVA